MMAVEMAVIQSGTVAATEMRAKTIRRSYCFLTWSVRSQRRRVDAG